MTEGSPRRRDRIAEDLRELGVPLVDGKTTTAILEEVDEALHPVPHERMVPTTGAVLAPGTNPTTWDQLTRLHIATVPAGGHSLSAARRYADGQSTWLLRTDPEPGKGLFFAG